MVTKFLSLFSRYAIKDRELFSLIFNNPFITHDPPSEFFLDLLIQLSQIGPLDLVKLIISQQPIYLDTLKYESVNHIFKLFYQYHLKIRSTPSDIDYLILLIPYLFEFPDNPNEKDAYTFSNCHFVLDILDLLDISGLISLLQRVLFIFLENENYDFTTFIICTTIYLINLDNSEYYPVITLILNNVSRNIYRYIVGGSGPNVSANYFKSL